MWLSIHAFSKDLMKAVLASLNDFREGHVLGLFSRREKVLILIYLQNKLRKSVPIASFLLDKLVLVTSKSLYWKRPIISSAIPTPRGPR